MGCSRSWSVACCVLVLLASSAPAQRRANAAVPVNLRPPVGMCRIWVDGVRPAQQPAPTDCATAVRNVPPKGHVIFGSDFVEPTSKKADPSAKKGEPPLKGVAPLSHSVELKSADKRAEDKKADLKKADAKQSLHKAIS